VNAINMASFRAANFARHKRRGGATARDAQRGGARFGDDILIFDRTSIAKYDFDQIINVFVPYLYYDNINISFNESRMQLR